VGFPWKMCCPQNSINQITPGSENTVLYNTVTVGAGSRASGNGNESSSPLLAGPAARWGKMLLTYQAGYCLRGNPLGVSPKNECGDKCQCVTRHGTARNAILIKRLPLLRFPLFPSLPIFTHRSHVSHLHRRKVPLRLP